LDFWFENKPSGNAAADDASDGFASRLFLRVFENLISKNDPGSWDQCYDFEKFREKM
jgi:hypothetical protein